MRTATAPSRAPARIEEEQPLVLVTNRRIPQKLGIILAIWVVGWLILRGKATLAMGGAETTHSQDLLVTLRNKVENLRAGNWFFHGVIGNLSDAINWAVTQLQHLFSTAPGDRPTPEIGFLGVIVLAAWITYAVAGWKASVLVAVVLVVFGFLGIWQDAIDLIIVTALAVAVCTVIGMPLGIAMARSRRVSAVFTPVLDVMQTMPSFAYLAPLALFWGIGSAAAIVTTFIYAMPPLARITEHAIRGVEETTVEAARSLGLTRGQLLRKVQLPMARRTIVVGLNQATLAALAMATVTALVNGPGLGQDVLQALNALNVGQAFVGGLGIVLAAIMLDRTTTAASERSGRTAATRRRGPVWLRTAILGGGAVVVLYCLWASHTYLWAAQWPESFMHGSNVASAVNTFTDWFVNTFDVVTNALKNIVTYGLLNPLQSLLANTPWWLMASVLLAIAATLGGRRAALYTVVCEGVIFACGLWNDAMQTLTMTLVATVLVMAIAIVLGVWMGRSHRADIGVRPVLDAFQTIPSFVYLVPALALFSSTRFTAIVAAVAYAFPVATKLVADGIRGVSETTLEATRAVGTTTWQTITKVQLPMARSGLILATNQGLLYVLSMVVIGGLVGAGSLGYFVVAGLSQRDLFGKGLAAGIAITAMGIMLDRIMRYAAARQE
ncbi:MAG: ABC transporter permease subunit [Nostocoides sp.]